MVVEDHCGAHFLFIRAKSFEKSEQYRKAYGARNGDKSDGRQEKSAGNSQGAVPTGGYIQR